MSRFIFCNRWEAGGELHAFFTLVFWGSRNRGRNNSARPVCKLCNNLLHPNFTTHRDKFKNNSER